MHTNTAEKYIEEEQITSAVPFGSKAVLQKLDEELALLREAVSKIDPNSMDPGDIWALPIYQKIIQRRERLAACLAGV